ncbi:hypothetical protein [Streptomyces monomycini]|uniref:hypothetical protein n=1 Tax=Streptomyces monomycini TaxID=371720 RepID=UPI0004AB29AC|nr:hypothetical protein [Streptomyces monomycini]
MTTTTTTTTGTAARPAPAAGRELLRTVLRIDSWSTAAFGVVLLAGGKPLSAPLGIPTTWSLPLGIAMLGGAAALALIAGYPRIPKGPATTVVVGNSLSFVAMLLLAVSGLLPLTGLGSVFLLIGAVVVAVYAVLGYVGLRRYAGAGQG